MESKKKKKKKKKVIGAGQYRRSTQKEAILETGNQDSRHKAYELGISVNNESRGNESMRRV
jgi:hypothetical protein